jgi:hypothetical protein
VTKPRSIVSDVSNGVTDTEDDESGSAFNDSHDVVIHEVGPEAFRELSIQPRMFDISRHLPSLYEDTLRDLIDNEKLERNNADSQ